MVQATGETGAVKSTIDGVMQSSLADLPCHVETVKADSVTEPRAELSRVRKDPRARSDLDRLQPPRGAATNEAVDGKASPCRLRVFRLLAHGSS